MRDKDKCDCESCTCDKPFQKLVDTSSDRYTRDIKKIVVEQPVVFDIPDTWVHKDERQDPLVQRVVDNILKRSEVGMKTYKVSMEDADKPVEDWITDAQEELTDAVIYLEKVKQKIRDLDIK